MEPQVAEAQQKHEPPLSVRRSRLPSLLVFGLAPLAVLGLDVALRGARLVALEPRLKWAYLASVVASALLWALWLLATVGGRLVHRLYRAGFVFLFTLVVSGQAYFFEQYSAYLNADVSRFATNFTDSIVSQLLADAGNYLRKQMPALLLALVIVLLARKSPDLQGRQQRWAFWGAPAALLFTFFLPFHHRKEQAASPDMLYFHAMGGLIGTQLGLSDESGQVRPKARQSLKVPRMSASPSRPRNVVFVILESVRADAVCTEPGAECLKTKATNQLFPNRIPLRQVRALDSSTAISLAVLWSGVGPHETREVLHSWPLVFDYARAAGWQTAYWTSQNMMFGNVRLWVKNLGVDSFFHATDVDPEADIDLGAREDWFAERAISEVAQLKEPFLLSIQLSNGHYPYYVNDKGPQPFQPAALSKGPEDNDRFRNYYQNAVFQQDQHLARVLAALRGAPFGPRTVIVYTSDHGEAFREHYQMGHTFSVFDEEIKVPGFVDAPPGTLSEDEERALRSKSDEFVFHPDLTATVLDLVGVWDHQELDAFRGKMLGHSLLRSGRNDRALPLTNCAEVWSCAFENWGYMRRSMKLEARAWDPEYHCYDVALDPGEKNNLGALACGDLLTSAYQLFGRLPGKNP